MKIQKIDEFARKATRYSGSIEYAGDCSQITQQEWDTRMKGARTYPYKDLTELIRRDCPSIYKKLMLNLRNPYEKDTFETDEYLVLTHSATEHFFRKQDKVNECIHPVETDLENLEDGEYEGYRYGCWFELKNGFKFRVKGGAVKTSRNLAPLKRYRVENGYCSEVSPEAPREQPVSNEYRFN